ncbi:MAG TPA: hypothetical protein VFI84_02395 [Candidatus Saccharimonadales bacterium]|nr:hypothetical protein [Candidatus Saccharimonadales bacterium]
MHHWQDTILAVSILGFNIALVPTVFGKSKPHLSTSITTVIFLLATVVVYVSLSLWYSASMGFLNATLWTILATQRWLQGRKPHGNTVDKT